MVAAKELLDAFFKEAPEARAGNLDMEELNELMSSYQMDISRRLRITPAPAARAAH